VADRLREALAHVDDCSGCPSNVLYGVAVIHLLSHSGAKPSWRRIFEGIVIFGSSAS
jgi:hypothetical protein